ncbi:MAG: carboxylesterase family protein [Actinobacteria bacterium]|nr:carboxylesterase family protein [Actinomycetota bacterium]MBU1944271.1 carboxylesterase family protein [Actinomycetota bacterium]MBU2688824.1 carboxylesterase family protein [Actinomycetota bacterium]
MTATDVIELDLGSISGDNHGEVTSYLGIPYASPPLGESRWKPPQPVVPWVGVRECTGYGPACPQPKSKFYDVGNTSEDCLFLNIWVPANGREAKVPVLVWVHGGAFTTGAGSLGLYEGMNLAAQGVLVVTINYRLGPLGFLALPGLSDESPFSVSGNYGLLDQIAALEWIQSNVSQFGGDKDNVTLFGESAGAVSACHLLSSPLTTGLFHRAIVESGPIWVEKGLPAASRPLETAEKTGLKLVEELGLVDKSNSVSSLRAVTAEKLVETASPGEGLAVLKNELQFGPVIDGWLLPGNPVSQIAQGNVHDLPLLVGANANEANLFLEGMTVTGDSFEKIVNLVFGEYSNEVIDMFPLGENEDAATILSELFTVNEFIAPARFLAESFGSLQSNSYLYNFSRVAPGNPLGACHGSEIPYVFGNFDQALGYTDADHRLSRTIMSYWTAFARTGNPNRNGLPEWPPYSKEEDKLLQFGETISANKGLYSEACDLAERIHLGE